MGDTKAMAEFAPHTGAWIETLLLSELSEPASFAPHTGAWIETVHQGSDTVNACSHPTRVRGLKLAVAMADKWCWFAPHTGAWIETGVIPQLLSIVSFAPHTGAWIETRNNRAVCSRLFRTPHGCVD